MPRLLFVVSWVVSLVPTSVTASPISVNPNSREITRLSRCTTNIILPSPKDKCSDSCRTVQGIQRQCDDHYACMCEKAPPATLVSCLQCAANDEFTAPLSDEYTNTCAFIQYLPVDPNGMPSRTVTLNFFNGTKVPCLLQNDGISMGSSIVNRDNLFRDWAPYLSIVSAVLFLAILTNTFRRK